MSKIVSANLDKESEKIYNKINRTRLYGWFSKDVNLMLKLKYDTDKKQLIQKLQDKQEKRNKLDDKIKEIAKQINRMKDD